MQNYSPSHAHNISPAFYQNTISGPIQLPCKRSFQTSNALASNAKHFRGEHQDSESLLLIPTNGLAPLQAILTDKPLPQDIPQNNKTIPNILCHNLFSDTCSTDQDTSNGSARINIFENLALEMERAFQVVKSNIAGFARFVSGNVGFSKINGMIDAIVSSNERLQSLACKLRPLPAISLKNLAMLRKDVDHIIDWWNDIDHSHKEYMKDCKFLYYNLGIDVIDFSKLNVLSLIRKKPRSINRSMCEGFVRYQKI